MVFEIEILSVVGPVKNQKGKNSWNAIEVAYKKDGKIEGKKIVDFNNQDVFKAVSQAKQGETYTVEAEKINDFWQWVGFTKTGTSQAPAESKTQSVENSKGVETPKSYGGGGGSGRVTGSNYETPEERAVKQRFIIRQSCLAQAIEVAKHNAVSNKSVVDLMFVITQAEEFVKFVYKPEFGVEGLKSMKDDIPF